MYKSHTLGQKNYMLIQDETLISLVILPEYLNFCFPIKFGP